MKSNTIILSSLSYQTPGSHLRLPPTLNKIHKIKKALLIIPHLRRAIHRLNAKVRIIIAKLPIISKTPSKRANKLHPILPNRLQALVQVVLVVLAARAIEQLVFQLLQRFAEDGLAELGHCDGRLEGVPEVVEVRAEVGGCCVDVSLAAVSDVPLRVVDGCALGYAVRTQRVRDVGGAFGDGAVGGRADYGCCVGLDGEEVRRAVDVGEVGGGQGHVVGYCHLERFGVVDAEEDGIRESCELERVEVVCSVDVSRVLRIAGHSEVVVEGDRYFSCALDVLVVEVIETRVCLDDSVD